MDLAGHQWNKRPGFLDTASYGLPSERSWSQLQSALEEWRDGSGVWEQWGEYTHRARRLFAQMIGADPAHVAVGSTTSQLISIISSSLPRGATVVVPEIEFTSNLFPFMVAKQRGITTKVVPFESFLDSIDSSIHLVAVSAVQSSTGEITDLEEVKTRCAETGTLLVVDATQAAGWLPLSVEGVDALVCSGYKWLMAPRGTAYMALSDRMMQDVSPIAANWFAGASIEDSYYGPPLRLAKSARALDISPAWFSWVGAVASLEAISEVGVDSIYAHNVALANTLAAKLDLLQPNSAIMRVAVDEDIAPSSLPIRASLRMGMLRLSFHLYNNEDDVELACKALLDIIRR